MLLFFTGSVYAGDPLGFSSNWNYRETGGVNTGSSQLNQSYNLTYSKDLSSALSLSSSVRYSENKPSEGAGSRTLSPNLSLDLRNDLFSLNLNAAETKSEQDGAATRTSDSWGVNLRSQIDQWPSMRFYYNQSLASDDNRPKQTDSNSQTAGASVEYSFRQFEFLYDVRHSQSADDIQLSESKTFDQTAQVSYAQSFLQGRVSLSASQQLQLTENNTDTLVGVGNTFDAPLAINGRFYYEDNDLDTIFLPVAESFQGKDVLASTEDKNLILDISGPVNDLSPIEGVFNRVKVWLYREVGTDRLPLLFVDPLDDAGDWLVYYRDAVDTEWTEIALPAGSLTVTEDRLNGNLRTVIIIDLPGDFSADFVKVVATDTFPLREAFVDDFMAYRSFVATTDIVSLTRDTTSLQSQFNSTIRLTDKWSVSYNFRRVETRLDSGDSVQFNQSLTSSYLLNDKVSFSLGVAENSDESDNSADQKNRSYSMSMAVQPLPTMNFSVAYTRSESRSDDGNETLNSTLSSSLNAAIYPDLSARLSTSWTQSENLEDGAESSSYGLNLNTTAYLSPKADMTTSFSYSESDSSSGETSSSTNYGLNLGYRPSDMLLVNCGYSSEIENGNSSLTANSSWLWSRKLQSQLGLSFGFGDETSQQYNALLSWLINRSLSFQSSGNFLVADEGNSWNINSSLNLVY